MSEIKQMGRPSISPRERDIYDRKRRAVIKAMPKTYMADLNEYCILNELPKIPAQKVYNFQYGVTYNSETLSILQGFIASLKK